MESLNQFYEVVKAGSVERFNAASEHIPLFVLEAPKGVIYVPCPWADDRQKQMAVAAVRAIARQIGATRVVTVTEGWMITRPINAPDDGISPSHAPDRREVLWIIGESSISGEARCGGYFDIVRTAPDRATIGGFTDMSGPGDVSIFDNIVSERTLQ